VSELGGPEMPAIGFALGLSRLCLAMEAEGLSDICEKSPDLYIAPLGEKASLKCFAISESLRRNDIECETDITGRSVKAQLKYADKRGFENVLVVGDTEIENGKAEIKNLRTGDKETVLLTADAIKAFIKK